MTDNGARDLAERIGPTVGEWFDIGHENGKLDTADLAARLVAFLPDAVELDRLRAALVRIAGSALVVKGRCGYCDAPKVSGRFDASWHRDDCVFVVAAAALQPEGSEPVRWHWTEVYDVPPEMAGERDVLALAAVIRKVDGNHNLGASALAAAILANGAAFLPDAAELDRLRRIEAAARAFMTDDYTWDRQEQGDPGPVLRRLLQPEGSGARDGG